MYTSFGSRWWRSGSGERDAMTEQFDAFLAQTRSLATLVETETDVIAARMRRLLSMEEVYGIRQIILTGSGDSYFAALAAVPAMRAWTGLPVSAMVSMEAARYVDHGRPPLAGRNRGLLVVSISSSGEAARLVEATQRLRKLGAITLAITANDDSRLGQSAEKRLNIAIPPAPPAPGTRSYVASLIGVYQLGIRLAEMLMCMTMDQAEVLRRQLKATATALAGLSERCEGPIAERIAAWGDVAAMDCLGSGPSLASAYYASAKLVEAAGIHASPQDAEEFHHLNYFADQPERLPAILFAPSQAISKTRTKELVATLTELGRPHLVVTDTSGFAPADVSLVLPETPEFFAPIVQTVPAALLSAFAAKRRGVVHYRGHTGPWRGAQNAGLVRNSKIELPE